MPNNLSEWFGLITTLIAIGGVGWGYYSWRKSELRHADIHTWSLAGIEALQSLSLALSSDLIGGKLESNDDRIADAFFKTSILVEQGRLYFRNYHHRSGPLKDFGKEKHPAYRGIRPRILDCLIMGHEIAARWPNANDELRKELLYASNFSVREFVSLSQKEVGRNRTACEETREPGSGSPLDVLLCMRRNNNQSGGT